MSEQADKAREAARKQRDAADAAADRADKAEGTDAAKAAQARREAEQRAEEVKLAAENAGKSDADKASLRAADAAKAEGLDARELAIDAREKDFEARLKRMEDALLGGATGLQGAPLDQPKSTHVLSPGSQNDPAAVGVAGAMSGVTSGPKLQPHPLAGTDASARPMFDWVDGEVTVWGRDQHGRVIRPTEYPQLTEQDVRLTKTIYIDDAIRNAGEIMRQYTGPLGSGMIPIGPDGKDLPRSQYDKR
jgi:hypothetical protein